MRRYLVTFIIVSTLTGLGLVGINWLVDPYRIFGAPSIAGFNSIKTRLIPNSRIFKVVNLARQKPEVVLLGTSRAEIGLSPLHPVFAGKKTVNLAMAAQPYSETSQLVDYLTSRQTRQIVFGIDFFVANALLLPHSGIVRENFSPYRQLQLLMSASSVLDSIKTVRRIGNLVEFTDEEGQVHLGKGAGFSGVRREFMHSEQKYLECQYFPAPDFKFEFTGRQGHTPLENIRTLLARVYSENIDLRFFISPSHARQWETLAAAGLWYKWEEWKRKLVKMNEEEAAKAGKPPLQIWDFSGYDSISTEAVPPLDNMQISMKNYTDSSHYTSAVGNLVLDRIFNYHSSDRTVPDDFGVCINSGNIDVHLARIRSDREQYRRTHPDDVTEIEVMAQKVAHNKHCR